MKKILHIALLVLPLSLSITSCDIDRIPEDAISDDTFWKSEADLKGAANYLYTGLPSFNTEDNWSDDSYGRSSNTISDGSRLVPATDGGYNGQYALIRVANNLLEKSEGLVGVVADANLKLYQAEAKFFRAFAYFTLVQKYGKVPLITRTLTETSEELFQPAAEREAIFDQIYADLDFAGANVKKRSAMVAGEYGRISQTAVWAFKARVGLFEGTRSKYHAYGTPAKHLTIAKESSQKVIDSKEHSLFANFFGMFQYEGEGVANKENILVRQYGVSRTDYVVTHNYFRASIEQGQINPTKSLVDSYLMSDGLPMDKSPLYVKPTTTLEVFKNRDERLSGTVLKRGDSYIGSKPVFDVANLSFNTTGFAFRKYTNVDDWTLSRSTMDLPVIRYAEVLLINAEANFELAGNISDATLDATLNLLRKRGKIAPLSNAFVTANGLDMKTEIRRERRVELAQEGFRYWDLIRWKTAENELPQDMLGNFYFATEYGTAVPVTLTPDNYIVASPKKFRSFNPAKDYLFPLPLNEIALNPSLVQNPGWK